MQVTVLHLQDDLDAVHILRSYEFSFPNLRLRITPKFGKFFFQHSKEVIGKSDVVVLFISETGIPLDSKTIKELKEAIRQRKPIIVVMPSRAKLPSLLSTYDNVVVYKPIVKYMEEIFRSVKSSSNAIDLLVYKLLSELFFKERIKARQ